MNNFQKVLSKATTWLADEIATRKSLKTRNPVTWFLNKWILAELSIAYRLYSSLETE